MMKYIIFFLNKEKLFPYSPRIILLVRFQLNEIDGFLCIIIIF